MKDLTTEYKRLYNLYIEKSDEDLQEITNPENEYTEIAVKVASDILNYGRIDCEKAIEKQGGIIEVPHHDNIDKAVSKRTPPWLMAVAIICGMIAGAVLISGISDLQHASKSQDMSDNLIVGNYYDGSDDYFGIVFYFIDENTFGYTTYSGSTIAYGTYDISGNALTLNVSSESYAAVIIEDGGKIMINDSVLSKTTDTDLITHYNEIFTTID